MTDPAETSTTQPSTPSKAKVNWAKWQLDAQYALREARHQKGQFLIGCGSVFLVVLLVALLMTVLAYSPVVFLSLAEQQAGELDLVLQSARQRSRLDAAALARVSDQAAYSVPRLVLSAVDAYAVSECALVSRDQGLVSADAAWTYSGQWPANQSCADQSGGDNMKLAAQCIGTLCPVTTPVTLYLVDTVRESQLGIGRQWTMGRIPAGSVVIHDKVARSMQSGLSVGDWLVLQLDLQAVVPVWFQRQQEMLAKMAGMSSINMTIVNMMVRVHRILDSNLGKVGQQSQDTVFMEMDTVMAHLAKFMHPMYIQSVKDTVAAVPMSELEQEATHLLVSCGQYRITCYLNSDYSQVAWSVVDWAADIMLRINFQEVNPQLPVLSNLQSSMMYASFLNLIFGLMVTLIVGLSAFLIYSLLMVSVETKTFEMGIFRMIGMEKLDVIALIAAQALSYALPAWVCGMVLAQVCWSIARYYLSTALYMEVEPMLSSTAFWLATFLGLVVPLVAAILPIRRALGENLRDALDTRRAKTKAVVISVERSQGDGTPLWMIASGLLLVSLGFMVYYFLPRAMVYQDMTTMFNIFLVLLLGMMFGLILLASNLQSLIERLLVFVFMSLMFFENRSMGLLVRKNLVAHRLRNRKTALMYAMALGFIIFLTVVLRIEVSSMGYQIRQAFGGDMDISTGAGWGNGGSFGPNISTIEDYLLKHPLVKDFTYYSSPFAELNSSSTGGMISNVGKMTAFSSQLFAVPPHIFSIADSAFLTVYSTDTTSYPGFSLAERLYVPSGMNKMVTGSLFVSKLFLSGLDTLFFYYTMISTKMGYLRMQWFTSTAAFLSSAPYFTFSSFPSRTSQDGLVSFTNYLQKAGKLAGLQSVHQIPIRSVKVTFVDGTSRLDAKNFMLEVSAVFPESSVSLVQDQLDSVASSESTLNLIFSAVTLVILVISFFSLNASMVTNVNEQQKEIGVLRALGLHRWQVFRLFAYEAFFLILASAAIGTMIGVIIGWTMSAQRTILTQVPLSFVFPWDLFLLVFGVSIVCAVFATIGPVSKLVFKGRVVKLLR